MPPRMIVNPAWREFGSATGKLYFDALTQHGSMREAAEALGKSQGTISEVIGLMRRKAEEAAREGYAPGHFDQGVAPGYRMGKVTIQRTAAGVERVWERQHPDDALRHAAFRAMVEGLKDELPREAPVPEPTATLDALLSVYPQGDPHAGMYAWAEETGEAFDLDIWEAMNRRAIDRLVAGAPPSHSALFIDLGDSTHADNSKNRTPKHGHQLDVHGRHGEVVRRAMRLKRYQVRRLLEKHQHVTYRINPGNHDIETALSLMVMLEAIYENEPRVTVITSPNPYWYMGWGRNLIGTTHGDGAKGAALPLLMACDVPQLWAASEHGARVWFVGHVHHKDIKDYNGVTVEYTRTLAPADHHTHASGYRTRRTMECVTLHKVDGEETRNTVGLSHIRGARLDPTS